MIDILSLKRERREEASDGKAMGHYLQYTDLFGHTIPVDGGLSA